MVERFTTAHIDRMNFGLGGAIAAQFHPEHDHEFKKKMPGDMFRMIDTDGDNVVTKEELQNACSKKIVRDALMLVFPDQDLDTIFAKLDTNPDGEITEEEFTQALTNKL